MRETKYLNDRAMSVYTDIRQEGIFMPSKNTSGEELTSEPESLDQAFDAPADEDKDQEASLPADEVADAEPAETAEGPEEPDQPAAEPGADDASASVADKPGSVWEKRGLTEFDGLSEDDIAKRITLMKEQLEYSNQVRGNSANELGVLRHKVEQFEKERNEAEKAKAEPAEPVIPKMSEGELHDYKTMQETNPIGAIYKYVLPRLQSSIDEQVRKSLETGVQGPMTKAMQDHQERVDWANFCAKHPDMDRVAVNGMKILDGPEYLGEQHRPYDDLFELTQMSIGNDPLYNATYFQMKKYPQMPIAQAKKYAAAELAAKDNAKTKKEQLQKEHADLDKANVPSTKTRSESPPKVFSGMDEAFDSVGDE